MASEELSGKRLSVLMGEAWPEPTPEQKRLAKRGQSVTKEEADAIAIARQAITQKRAEIEDQIDELQQERNRLLAEEMKDQDWA